MDILTIIKGRDLAYGAINALCGKTADKNPYAWEKLDAIRRYLRTETIREVAHYFNKEEPTNVKP
jgi:hypothetical protein